MLQLENGQMEIVRDVGGQIDALSLPLSQCCGAVIYTCIYKTRGHSLSAYIGILRSAPGWGFAVQREIRFAQASCNLMPQAHQTHSSPPPPNPRKLKSAKHTAKPVQREFRNNALSIYTC